MKRQTKRECDRYRTVGNYRIPKLALRYRTNLRHPRLDKMQSITSSLLVILSLVFYSLSFCYSCIVSSFSRTSCNQRLRTVTLRYRRMIHNRPNSWTDHPLLQHTSASLDLAEKDFTLASWGGNEVGGSARRVQPVLERTSRSAIDQTTSPARTLPARALSLESPCRLRQVCSEAKR